MSDLDLPVAASAWVPSPLLQGQSSPRFVRVAWDEKKVDRFGPWRIGRSPDPADAMNQDLLTPEASPEESVPPPVMAAEPDASPAPVGVSPQELAVLEAQAYQRGIADGRAQALAETQAQQARDGELLQRIARECQGLVQDPQRLTEPLRRLALHLAEHLVRAELHLSGKAISALVEQVVAQLDGAQPVVVYLSPGDWDRVQAMRGDPQPGIQWVPDPDLLSGSVRVRANDTAVEDLMQHRLESLADQLLLERPARPHLGRRAPSGRRSLSDVEDVTDLSSKGGRMHPSRTQAEDQ